MSSSHKYSLSRPLPSSISSHRAISLLHSPSSIIKLSPLVIDHHLLPKSQVSSARASETYSITDRIEYLPFGLFPRDVTVTAEFTNQVDGTTATRFAPLGVMIKECWRVQEGWKDNSEQTAKELVLMLEVELIASKVVLAVFKSMMEKNHQGYIDGMVKLIIEDGKTGTTT